MRFDLWVVDEHWQEEPPPVDISSDSKRSQCASVIGVLSPNDQTFFGYAAALFEVVLPGGW